MQRHRPDACGKNAVPRGFGPVRARHFASGPGNLLRQGWRFGLCLAHGCDRSRNHRPRYWPGPFSTLLETARSTRITRDHLQACREVLSPTHHQFLTRSGIVPRFAINRSILWRAFILSVQSSLRASPIPDDQVLRRSSAVGRPGESWAAAPITSPQPRADSRRAYVEDKARKARRSALCCYSPMVPLPCRVR